MEVRSWLTGLRGVCLPFSDFCAPIGGLEARSSKLEARDNEVKHLLTPSSELRAPSSEPGLRTSDSVRRPLPSALSPLLSAAADLGRSRGWRYLEWRGGPKPPGATRSTTLWGHTVDLSADEPELRKRLDSSTRRSLRKAEKSGVTVVFRTDPAAMAEYYRLHCLTRRKHGLPPQPYRFFEKIHEHLISKSQGFVALAGLRARAGEGREERGESVGACEPTVSNGSQLPSCLSPLPSPLSCPRPSAIAGAVFLRFGPSAIYKFGASDDRYQDLRPNNLLMWKSFLHCRELGCTSVHLGRTNVGQEGLRRFKLGWGAREEAIDYYKLDLKTGAWLTEHDHTEGWHNHVFANLPLALNRIAGQILYPHLD